MRKLSLILAILLLMTSCVFTACDKKSNSDSEEKEDSSEEKENSSNNSESVKNEKISGPKEAVKTALDVIYGDGDADPDDYYEVALRCNTDILDFIENSDDASSYKESARETQKAMKESLNLLKDADKEAEDQDYDDWDFSYEFIYCNIYKKTEGENFDNLIESFPYADTDIEDEVTAIAKVGILMITEYEKDGETYTSVNTQTFTVYEIDGNWYIG